MREVWGCGELKMSRSALEDGRGKRLSESTAEPTGCGRNLTKACVSYLALFSPTVAWEKGM